MMVHLTKLVEGCVDAHINSPTTKDASKHFRALIQHAYDIGVRDAKEEARQAAEALAKSKADAKSGKEKGSDKGKAKEEGSAKEAESQSTGGNGSVIPTGVTDAVTAKAVAKAIANL